MSRIVAIGILSKSNDFIQHPEDHAVCCAARLMREKEKGPL